MNTSCFSFLADIFSGHERSIRITIASSAFALIGSLSDIWMGYFIDGTGFLYPCILLFAFDILNVIYVLTFVQESRERNNEDKVCTLTHVKTGFQVIFRPTIKRNRWKMYLALSGFVISAIIMINRWGLQNLFLMNSPLCWGSVLLGYFSAATSVIAETSCLILSKLFVKKLGEIRLIILGCVSGATSLIALSVATEWWITLFGKRVHYFKVSLLRDFLTLSSMGSSLSFCSLNRMTLVTSDYHGVEDHFIFLWREAIKQIMTIFLLHVCIFAILLSVPTLGFANKLITPMFRSVLPGLVAHNEHGKYILLIPLWISL